MSVDNTSDLAGSAAPLDALLVQGARGGLRRFSPNSSTVRWVGTLTRHPRSTARRVRDLAIDTAGIALGSSRFEPDRQDRRFADEAWKENPFLHRLAQLYLAGAETLEHLITDARLNERDEKRLRFLVENVYEALSPSNVPLVNPASAKAAIDTGGLSLLRGGSQLVKDFSKAPRIPEMVDTTAFELGRDIAATPGSVVFRSEVLELMQYQPQTDEVWETPILMVPPTINKFYAIDLAPGRSLVEYNVKEGRQTFVISWRNPDVRHASWDFDTYVSSIIEALDAVERITGAQQTLLGGICSGGILASITAAYLAAIGQLQRLKALVLAVTVIDTDNSGTTDAITSPRLAAAAKQISKRQGYLDGRALAEVFAWLRPGDLIWNYWVNNYLCGRRPPAFDILFWNADTTRMSAGLHADFIDLSQGNLLTKPGALTVLGQPIDLSSVTIDAYIAAGIADHITPWENCYRTTGLFGGDSRFVLSTSGHIAALVNPPGNSKSTYRTHKDNVEDPAEWLDQAEVHQDSWWLDLTSWLADRSGNRIPAPEQLGEPGTGELAPAPGTYVFDQ